MSPCLFILAMSSLLVSTPGDDDPFAFPVEPKKPVQSKKVEQRNEPTPAASAARRKIGQLGGHFIPVGKVHGSTQPGPGRLHVSLARQWKGTDADLALLADLPLHVLTLAGDWVTDASVQSLPAMETLDEIAIHGAKVSDAAPARLAAMKGLWRIDLSETGLTDKGLKHLSGINTLRSLNLSATAVTDKGLAHLAGLADLTHLDLSATGVKGRGLRHLAGMKNLTTLDLSQTAVTGKTFQHFSDHQMLEKISLDRTPRLTDKGLARLRGLSRLEELHLVSAKRLKGVGFAGDGAFPALKSLFLGHAPKITDKGLHAIGQLPSLRTLEIGYNHPNEAPVDLNISGAGLASLGQVESLTLVAKRIPDDWLTAADNWLEMRTLFLSGLALEGGGARHLGACAKLERLSLNCGRIDALAIDQSWHVRSLAGFELRIGRLELKQAARLESVDLRGLKCDQCVFQGLPLLERLLIQGAVSKCRLADLPELQRLSVQSSIPCSFDWQPADAKKLAELQILASKLLPGDWRLDTLENLQKLDVRYVEAPREWLRSIWKHPKLSTLYVYGKAFDDDWLAAVEQDSSIRWLTIWGAPVTDEGIQHLARARNLRRLRISCTRVTADGLRKLKSAAPRIFIEFPCPNLEYEE